jgi:hypothetical protein
MTAFVEKFALEVATTFAVGAVTAFLVGLSSTHAPTSRPRSSCPHCGAASRERSGPRRGG